MSEKKTSKIRDAQDELDRLSERLREAESSLEEIRQLRIRVFAKLSKLVKEATS